LTDEDRFQDMESLLQDESLDFRTLRRGDVVEGRVMGLLRDGVLVDFGSKSEGIIPPNEMHSLGAEPMSRIKVGDTVLAYVLQPETPEGQVLLSLDRARGERGWRVLQQRFDEGESFEAEVTGHNKGGLLVTVEGVNAFVPLSQVVGVRPEHPDGEVSENALAAMAGRQLRVKVIEINRHRNRLILSERQAVQERRDVMKAKLIEREKAAFGLFITLEEPSKEMQLEADTAGLYRSDVWKRDYPKIQIMTIKELLEDRKKPALPPFVMPTYQQAERIYLEVVDQGSLFDVKPAKSAKPRSSQSN